jgi:hypothetical protein
VIQKGKRISREDATDARAGWAGWDSFSLWGWHSRWAGWAEAERAESKEKMISELKIGFLNLSRLWKFVEADLGRILT